MLVRGGGVPAPPWLPLHHVGQGSERTEPARQGDGIVTRTSLVPHRLVIRKGVLTGEGRGVTVDQVHVVKDTETLTGSHTDRAALPVDMEGLQFREIASMEEVFSGLCPELADAVSLCSRNKKCDRLHASLVSTAYA